MRANASHVKPVPYFLDYEWSGPRRFGPNDGLPHKRLVATVHEYSATALWANGVHMLDTVRWIALAVGCPIASPPRRHLRSVKAAKSNIPDTQPRPFEYPVQPCVGSNMAPGATPPVPTIRGRYSSSAKKASLKASTMRADFQSSTRASHPL